MKHDKILGYVPYLTITPSMAEPPKKKKVGEKMN